MAEPIDPARLETLPPTVPAGPTRGTPLGSRYLLERVIGAGSTGRVWQGVRQADGSAVAVKVLRAEYLPDPTMVARFRREGLAVRRLVHPHLVAVEDLVVEDDVVAVVMALVDGDDLRRVIQRGGLDIREALTLLAQVAGALAYVHAEGVLHRDVKPENILLTRRAGQPWAMLGDFGVARVGGGRQLTRSTQMLGTPAYLAPELFTGRRYGPPVDVYAFGVTAYELLSGHRPFDGEHPVAVMRAHLDDEPPRPPGMSRDLWHLVRSCLAKRPEDRPSAADVAGRLASLATSGAAHARRRRWPGRRLTLVAGALAGTVALVPVGVRLWPGDTGRPAPAPTPAPTVVPLTRASGPIGAPGGGCLDDKAAIATQGNPVQSYQCNQTVAQVWTLGVGGTLQVVGQCLRAAGTADGAVQIWTCDGTPAQQWRLRVGGGLLNVGTGRCLESTGNSEARPVLRPCTGSPAQRWRLP